MIALLKTIATLGLLLVVFPINLLVVFLSLIISFLMAPFSKRKVIKNPKKVLLTGGKMTKSLQLARCFYNAGHEVILVETDKYWLSGHRFSRAVKGFYTVPAPEKDQEGYCQGLLNIVQQENIDIFIPVSSPVASYYDSVAGNLLAEHCEIMHFQPNITKMLDDKFELCEQAHLFGLSAPQAFLITDPQQILDFDFKNNQGRKYLLKSIKYDSVSRLDMTKLPFEGMEKYIKNLPISKDKPWAMQEFITGKEYCTHSTVRKGKIRLHCCSESSPFQINYEHIDKPEIYNWVEKFVKELNLSGQISFDFIQAEDGTVYPIECNPRTHSAITMFYNHPGVADAYLKDAENEEKAITPLTNSKPTYWLYHEIWRLTGIRSISDFQAWIKKITTGTDAIFQLNDPLPFLMNPHWQISLLLMQNLRPLKDWVKIDFNIGKLVEIGGD
ncbi:ATP-grasp enzyme [Crocosphaera sp.]|uniref:ATP-grasp domain-containing protein n=1 Tax=Crocosphaera sp. TaxID=2729996 RepID=UPI002622CD80|nr:ATP-grasp enzyme [Crocosphaera sp.]MDJ0581873.1 ATP-grasp enzyme [Crocosphaera sp.]